MVWSDWLSYVNKQFRLMNILSLPKFISILMKFTSPTKKFKSTQTVEIFFSLLLSFITISLINFWIRVVLISKDVFLCFVTFLEISPNHPTALCFMCFYLFFPTALPLQHCDHQDENLAQWVRGETFRLYASELHYTLQHLRKLYSTNHILFFCKQHLIKKWT